LAVQQENLTFVAMAICCMGTARLKLMKLDQFSVLGMKLPAQEMGLARQVGFFQ
jgi:hypothetical protein